MPSGKPHHIRPLKHRHRKIHVRAECDKCGRFDVVSVYEDQVEHQDFKVSFWECQGCRRTFCNICVGDHSSVECPFCKKLKPKKITPFDYYVCGVCFKEWWREGGFCKACKYIDEENKPIKDGHYPGPPEK